MVRFFSVHNDALRGTHLHLTFTSHRRTFNDCAQEMKERLSTHSRTPVFYDFGPGDSDLRRIAPETFATPSTPSPLVGADGETTQGDTDAS